MKIWFDIINPPNVHFFNSIRNEITYDKFFTVRDKDENLGLCDYYGINYKIIGKEYKNKIMKNFNIIFRSIDLFNNTDFDYAIGFENPMSVIVAKMKYKKVILICDNDLKLFQHNTFVQDIETKVKSYADYMVIPKVCYETFSKIYKSNIILNFDGYKEDVYISSYIPDQNFLDKIPFKDYIIIRPEALNSYYIKEKTSIVNELIDLFTKHSQNIIFLPRDNLDINKMKISSNVFIPREPLNGLDLCYYSKAVLTGSGTMSREAAILGKPAVSFFPSNELLSVDSSLIKEGRIFHSRSSSEILDHVVNNRINFYKNNSKEIKKEFIEIINKILNQKI